MGPFPHNAPAPKVDEANPMGTDGFEFVEYAHPNPQELHTLFTDMGFTAVAKHRNKKLTLYRQGDINYVVNEEPGSHGFNFVAAHGPCAPSMAFRVVDAEQAYNRAIAHGAEPADPADGGRTLAVPAIKGIGGSLLYFVDTYGLKGSAYDTEFEWIGERDPTPYGVGLFYLDHLTHNVHRGRMVVWAGFYEKLFNFRQIRSFDIEGKLTGLFSKALTSPDGKIRILSTNLPMRTARSRNTCTRIEAKVFSTSPAAAVISTRLLRSCEPMGCPSCRRRPASTTSALISVCLVMGSPLTSSRRMEF